MDGPTGDDIPIAHYCEQCDAWFDTAERDAPCPTCGRWITWEDSARAPLEPLEPRTDAAVRLKRWQSVLDFLSREHAQLLEERRTLIQERDQIRAGRFIAKVAPFHSVNPSALHVHHDNTRCTGANNIDRQHRRSGTAGRPLCHHCAALARQGR